MDLSEFYPSPDKLIKSEVDILNYLRDNPYIKANQEQLATDAGLSYYAHRTDASGFAFDSHLELWHAPMHRGGIVATRTGRRRPNVRLAISARLETVNGIFSDVTYGLGVIRLRPKRITILRKFHFDVTPGSGDNQSDKQERPHCHIQYCGTLLPGGCRQSQLDQMHPWLSEPRLLFWPMSLALLLDMALHEFPDQASAKFRASNEWRSLVREQENLVLLGFFSKCVGVIEDKHKRKKTLADAFYVN
jgi:hypothetical protein